MVESNFQQSIEPLHGIHRYEYPLQQGKLQHIIMESMHGLELIAEKLEKIRNNLPPEEQSRCDSFLFYYNILKNNNVSPITVRVGLKIDRGNKNLKLVTYYLGDISSEESGEGLWAGWQIPDDINHPPKLKCNNLWTYFVPAYDKLSRSKQSMEQYIRKNLIDEHSDNLLKKLEGGSLLNGDIHFGWSQFKHFSDRVDRYLESGYNQLSKEEIERAKVELADRNLLRYINFQGEEVHVNKTPFEAWGEFQKENSELFKRLVELCTDSSKDYKPMTTELSKLLDEAFALLRAKGFSKYPDLSA